MIKDSGHRRVFKTGSMRDRAKGKGRYDLISPISMQALAEHFESGALKYSDRNWERGQPLSVYVDSALRHLFNLLEGKKDEDHATAAMWNCGALKHTMIMIERGLLPKDLYDLPSYIEKNESKEGEPK